MAEELNRLQTWVVASLWFAGMAVLALAGWYTYRPVLAERYVAKGEAALVTLRQKEADEAFALASRYGADVTVLRSYRVHDPKGFKGLIDEKGSTELRQKLEEALKEGAPTQLIERADVLAADGFLSLAQYPLLAAIERNPELPQAYHALVQVYDALGETELAATARANRDRLTKRYLWEEQGLLNPDGSLR